MVRRVTSRFVASKTRHLKAHAASDRIPRRPDSCFTRVPDFLQQVLDALHFLFLWGVEHHDGGPQHTHRTTHLPEQIKTFI